MMARQMTNRKPDFRLPIHNAGMVTWRKGIPTGAVEASDLGPNFTGRIWNDACDIGFILKSPKTGREILMVQTGHCRDGEGEVTIWIFESREGVMLNVLND